MYMTAAAKNAAVKFSSTQEMLNFKMDFQAALAFIGKLDEVDVKGVEPLGNVLEFYGGNETKMRSDADFERARVLTFTKEDFTSLNRHADKSTAYCYLAPTTVPNPERE